MDIWTTTDLFHLRLSTQQTQPLKCSIDTVLLVNKSATNLRKSFYLISSLSSVQCKAKQKRAFKQLIICSNHSVTRDHMGRLDVNAGFPKDFNME